MNRFAKLATAAVAAAGMTMAAPARADNDAAKVIAGLLGVAILGAVISDLSVFGPFPQQKRAAGQKLPETELCLC